MYFPLVDPFLCYLDLWLFYRDAINPGLPNNNADGSAMCKVLYEVPGWKAPPGRKVAVSSLIILDMSGIRISHTYVPTCQQVSLCVNMGSWVLAPALLSTHWITLNKSLSLSEPQSPLL